MIINNAANVTAEQTSDDIVGRGPVYRKELMSAAATGGHGILLVTFEPGARLNFHIHDYEQILVVTEGTGIVATRDEERVVTTGDVVYIAPGENHWHGATQDSRFSHIAMNWRGTRLVAPATIVSLIGSTHREAGWHAGAELDRGKYPAGVTVTDAAGNTYNVVTADVQASNGVVHVIDGVLMPTSGE